MLAPGSTITANRLVTDAQAGTVPDYINQGVGFMTGGAVALDTDVPNDSFYRAGIRQNAAGAFYSTTTTAGTDVWINGLRCSALGQLIVAEADATSYSNGNPITATGVLGVSDATSVVTDPNFANVRALLHCDGVNDATNFVDQIGHVVNTDTGVAMRTDVTKFGTASGRFNAATALLAMGYTTDFPMNGAYTLEFWLRLAALPGAARDIMSMVANNGGGNANQVAVLTSTAANVLNFYDGIDSLTSYTLLADSTFHHIAVARVGAVGTALKVFVDGNIVLARNGGFRSETNTALVAGCNFHLNNSSIIGHMDDIRLTTGVCRYTAAFTPPAAPFPNS